jgi:hypothetical protein
LVTAASIAACGGPAVAPPAPKLALGGYDFGYRYANLTVRLPSKQGEMEVSDAGVTVNGAAIPFEVAVGRYAGQFPMPIPKAVFLEVHWSGAVVTGEGFLPDWPVLKAPPDGAIASVGSPLIVTWTSASAPSHFMVSASWEIDASSGTGMDFAAAPDARSFAIPPGVLPPDKDVTVQVFAYNAMFLAGDVAAGSAVNLRGELNRSVIHTTN